jgi:hypothetical protein
VRAGLDEGGARTPRGWLWRQGDGTRPFSLTRGLSPFLPKSTNEKNISDRYQQPDLYILARISSPFVWESKLRDFFIIPPWEGVGYPWSIFLFVQDPLPLQVLPSILFVDFIIFLPFFAILFACALRNTSKQQDTH